MERDRLADREMFYSTSEMRTLAKDALYLLKEKEPIEAETEGDRFNWYSVCGDCHGAIGDGDRFCRHCGREVKRVDTNEQKVNDAVFAAFDDGFREGMESMIQAFEKLGLIGNPMASLIREAIRTDVLSIVPDQERAKDIVDFYTEKIMNLM